MKNIQNKMIMPKHLILLFVTIFSLVSCKSDIEFDTRIKSFKHLRKHIKNVPNTFKTVPFWVWNDEITKEKIDVQIADYAEKGYGGLFIHPRYGLITEYASQEWYDLVSYAHRKAKKLGIDIWLYDENSFPSGFAGGHVPFEMPESYNQGHALRLHSQSILQLDSLKDYLLIQKITDSVADITQNANAFIGKKGKYRLFEKVYYPVRDWYAGFSYVDLLHPGVTEKFIELTMEGYEEQIRQSFGSSVPGIFTDEPNIAAQGSGALIRWTPDLFDAFNTRWGYRLEPHLISLLENDKMSSQVRHNYYQLLLELFIDRWSKPWYEYTEEMNLAWTGHYWEHGWPSPHHGPDNMAMYAWHQVPGIDMLFNNDETRPDQFGNVRAVKELNSVANQLGRIRRLSETYGASGWELDFEDMKRNGDWEYVLGVNLMNQHLSYQTLMGDRKHDFPQSFSYHAPYWDDIGVLNEYYGRLSLALSCGEQINRTLVLEPTTSAWMNYSLAGENTALDAIEKEFSTLLNLLESEQIEYDLGCESIIKDHGKVVEDRFVIGLGEYSSIIIPRFLTNMNSETAALLETYIKQGGIIIALCQAPDHIDGIKSDLFKNWAIEYPNQWLTLSGCNDPRFISYLRTDDFIFVEQEGGKLFHMRRQLDDGQLLFLVNSSKTESSQVRMVSAGKDLVHINLFNGDLENYPVVLSNEILSFDADIEPAGSVLLFIGNEDIKGKKQRERRWYGEAVPLELGEMSIKLEEANSLNLDYCRLIMDNDTSGLEYFYNQQTAIFRHHGFEVNPWVSASQFKSEIIERDTFPPGSGFTVQFPFFTDSRFSTHDLRLVVERPYLYEVSLNGVKLEQIEEEWWLDKSFGVFRISGEVNPGNNEISIKADPMSVFCELEPVYLIGDFDVMALDKGWFLATSSERSLGSWKDIGLPFYSDRVEYASTFELDKYSPIKITLPSWSGTVATVFVNGKKAGLIYKSPSELRLDDYVKKGKNTVSVSVCGSLKNLLGPHHNVKSRGVVTPWSFKYAPEDQPSGISYDLIDYGLLEPFTVEVLN